MLRLRFQASLAAMALCIAAPGHAQGGLGGRLHAAEQKLAQNSQRCVPINLGEYADLLREAAENKLRANKAAKKGAPVDEAKVDADLERAAALFNRAQSVLVQQCLRSTQGPAPSPSTDRTPLRSTDAQRARYFEARSRCDIEQMTEAGVVGSPVHLDEAWLDTVLAKPLDLPGDVKRCVTGEPTGSGTSPAPPYDPKYVTQPQLGTGPRTEQAQSIDPDHYGPVKIADPASVGGPLSPFAKEVLETHNKARAEYGAPPLKWDEGLVGGAVGAAAFAQQLARAGKMVHAPREGRGKVRENISQGLPWWSTRQLMENWTKEKAKFKPGRFPYVSNTGNWYEVGHWAQMIWINTVLIGCARAVGTAASWLVCRYSPGGNRDGELVGVPPTANFASRDGTIEAPKLPDREVYAGTSTRPKAIQGVTAGPGGPVVEIRPLDMDAMSDEDAEAEASGTFADYNHGPVLSVADALSQNVTGKFGYQGCFGEWSDQPLIGSIPVQFGNLPVDCETGVPLESSESVPVSGIYVGGALNPYLDHVPYLVSGFATPELADDSAAYEKFVMETLSGLKSAGSSLSDTVVEQPALPKTEVYGQTSPRMEAPQEQEGSNPSQKKCTNSYAEAYEAFLRYKGAKEEGSDSGMAAAKSQFAAAIAQLSQNIQDVSEVGEMADSRGNTVQLGQMKDWLEAMRTAYKNITGETAPAVSDSAEGSCSAANSVEPPELPATEVFKLDPKTNLEDPM